MCCWNHFATHRWKPRWYQVGRHLSTIPTSSTSITFPFGQILLIRIPHPDMHQNCQSPTELNSSSAFNLRCHTIKWWTKVLWIHPMLSVDDIHQSALRANVYRRSAFLPKIFLGKIDKSFPFCSSKERCEVGCLWTYRPWLTASSTWRVKNHWACLYEAGDLCLVRSWAYCVGVRGLRNEDSCWMIDWGTMVCAIFPGISCLYSIIYDFTRSSITLGHAIVCL